MSSSGFGTFQVFKFSDSSWRYKSFISISAESPFLFFNKMVCCIFLSTSYSFPWKSGFTLSIEPQQQALLFYFANLLSVFSQLKCLLGKISVRGSFGRLRPHVVDLVELFCVIEVAHTNFRVDRLCCRVCQLNIKSYALNEGVILRNR